MSVAGRPFRHDGAVYMAVTVKAESNVSFDDEWWSRIAARPATPAEERKMLLAELNAQLDKARNAWSDDPTDWSAIANRAKVERLRAEIAKLQEAGK